MTVATTEALGKILDALIREGWDNPGGGASPAPLPSPAPKAAPAASARKAASSQGAKVLARSPKEARERLWRKRKRRAKKGADQPAREREPVEA
jgi:hypothetical protein